ncbi:putative transcriptional regulators [Candidatus Termititenax persephonae]|uniref:Transcriptional regulators n=1 Tax=Candidatus Termititenax persephonae TaxID=2218525 RepID=A0A388TG32_9BACT|nr:putative transcriptional regulators [Candidatus Termititenax persephonae]
MKPSYVRIARIRSGFYKIERVCHLSGLTPAMLRYYEKIGLLPPPLRTSGGTRLYQDEHLRLLLEIVSAKRRGLSLREIKRKFTPRVQKNKTLFLVDSFFSPDPAILQRAAVRVMPMNIRFGYYKYADYTTLDPRRFAALENKKKILAEATPPTEGEYREALLRAAQEKATVVSLHPDSRFWDSYRLAKLAASGLAPAPLKIVDTGLWGGLNFYWERLLAAPQNLKNILAQAQKSVSEIFIVRSPERLFPAGQNQHYKLFDFTPIFQHTARSGLVPIAREKDFASACHYVWREIKSLSKIIAYSSPETLAAAHQLGLHAEKEIPLSSAFLAVFGREILAIFVKK